MKDIFITLFSKVKTWITLVALALWVYVTVTGVVDGEFFKTIFTVIISFYFGTQAQKAVIEAEQPEEEVADEVLHN